MTSSSSDSAKNFGSKQDAPSLPGVVIGLLSLLLAILTAPAVLKQVVSLDWRIGDLTLVVYVLEAAFACLGVAVLLARRRVSARYFRTFPTPKKLLFAATGVFLSIVFALAVGEVACRILGLPFDDKKHWTSSENALAQFDPELGWSYIPHRTVVQRFGSDQREIPMSFDAIGSRVRAPGVQHDPKAPSMLIVGDSYAFGHGLPYDETFAGRLEAMPDFPYQVVNLAVQGFGTDQALLRLERQFKDFNTKAVVYVYIDEAIARNANYDRRIMYRHIHVLGTKPLFGVRRDGSVYLRKKPIRYEQLEYSRVWACVRVVWSRWGPKPSVELTRALVRAMRDYVESRGAVFVVVNWYERDYRRWNPPSTLLPGQNPFEGMRLNVIHTADGAPLGWGDWLIPGDEHPDARANAYVAGLLYKAVVSRAAK